MEMIPYLVLLLGVVAAAVVYVLNEDGNDDGPPGYT